MKVFYYFLLLLPLTALTSCNRHKNDANIQEQVTKVRLNGKLITFPSQKAASFFKVKKVGDSHILAEISAPGQIAVSIIPSSESVSPQHIVLFDNPQLSDDYTQYVQHKINIRQLKTVNIRQRQIALERTADLQKHGAATEQDLMNAQLALSTEQTNLANEYAALVEHESNLKSEGLDPEILQKAGVGAVYIICEIPENQVEKIIENKRCTIIFNAFPEKQFTGSVEHIAETVDNITRMLKIRIRVNNANRQLITGMFATISFGVSEGKYISIDNNSLVTVQGKNYVFVRKNPLEFERRLVKTGAQSGNKTIVYSGLKNGEEIASEGIMQLKGLSFGY